MAFARVPLRLPPFLPAKPSECRMPPDTHHSPASPETQVDTERCKSLRHVVTEVRIEVQFLNVAEVIGGVPQRIAARQVDEMEYRCILPISAPELGDACEQVCVRRNRAATGIRF